MQTDIVQIQTCAILPHSIFLPLEKTIRGSIPSSLYFKHDKTEQNQDTVCFPLLLLFLLKPKKLATGTLEKCVYILSVIDLFWVASDEGQKTPRPPLVFK